MIEKFIHHVGIHAAQHPKETMGAALALGKTLAPVAIAAAPYVAGAAIIGGAIYGISKIFE